MPISKLSPTFVLYLLINTYSLAFAIAFAIIVFPVPGGPYNRIPFGMRVIFPLLNKWGLITKWLISLINFHSLLVLMEGLHFLQCYFSHPQVHQYRQSIHYLLHVGIQYLYLNYGKKFEVVLTLSD
jgi:hypothetical protein